MKTLFLLFFFIQSSRQEEHLAGECFGITLKQLFSKYSGDGAEEFKNILYSNPTSMSKTNQREWNRLSKKYTDNIAE
jgi:hypothetical protein